MQDQTAEQYVSENEPASPFPLRLAALALLGCVLSFVSLYHVLQLRAGVQVGPSFCNVSARLNCDAVNESPYAFFLGFPLAAWGLGFYATLALMAVASWGSKFRTTAVAAVTLVLAIIASVASIVLFFISEFVIGSLCTICAGMYVVNFILLYVSAAACREEGLVPSIRSGIGTLASFPKMLFQNGFLLFGTALVLGIFFIVPWSLNNKFLALREKSHFLMSPQEAVAAWKKAPQESISENLKGGALERDYVRGETAKIQVVEFSDFECPACRNFYGTLEELLRDYEGKIRFVFKNFPLDQSCNPSMPFDLHHNACLAATAARCAGEQGHFWEAVGHLFTLSAFDSKLPPAQVKSEVEGIGAALGVDDGAFRECVASNRYQGKISKDITEAMQLNIQSTPTLYVDGRKVPVMDRIGLRAIFDEALREHGGR